MKIFFVAGSLLIATASFAQADPGCQIANALLGALLKNQVTAPCGQQPVQRNRVIPQAPDVSLVDLDTPERLAAVMSNIRIKYARLDLGKPRTIGSSEFCDEELKPLLNYRADVRSGYKELLTKCLDEERPIRVEFVEANKRTMEQAKQQQLAEKDAEKRIQEQAQRLLITDLKSGKVPAANCAQFMVTKGYDDPATAAASVMAVAYQAPLGAGRFLGRVERIDSGTIVLSGNIPAIFRLTINVPDNAILLTDKSTRVFNGEAVQIGSMIQGFATQTGTKNVTLVNGKSSTVAVMKAICVSP